MIRTYITIAIKYLIRQPSYSILSILGFSLAFASVFMIYSHVSYQNDFDKHLDTWDRVYRLSGEINLPANENTHALLGPRLAPVMKEEIPAIEQITRMIPFRRIGEPSEVGDLAVFFASEESKYITGQVLSINGGQQMIG